MAEFARSVNVPVSTGEQLYNRWEFRPLLETNTVRMIQSDICHCGGFTEILKIASMAEAYYVPIAPHDASGPINVLAGAHVMMTVPNFYKLETARHRLVAYDNFIQTPLDVRRGQLHLPDAPGLGIDMNLALILANAG